MQKFVKLLVLFTFIFHSNLAETLNTPIESPEDSLLDNIVVDCSKKASLSCISKNTYRYLEKTFNSTENWEVTDSLKFKQNERTDIPAVQEAGTSRKSRDMDDITDAIYEKGVRFLNSHDLTWNLPETFFGGAVVKISAPGNANSRALFQVELLEPEVETITEAENRQDDTQIEGQQGRFFLKKLFGKNIKKKLLLGFFALLLIIKLIKIKLFFLLPLILGVGTVKKLAIKFLFFIFPALAALFKSCHHHHHHVPVKQYHLHTVKHSHPHYYHDDHHDWHRRNEYVPDTTAPSSWDPQPSGPYYGDEQISRFAPTATESSVYAPSSFTSDMADKQKAAQQAYRFQLQQQAAAVKQRYQQGGIIPSPQVPMKVGQLSHSSPLHQELTSAPSGLAATIPATSSTYDPFYSPILTKLESVFTQMGFNDEPCRERLVCSMYKTPTRFSPHSNLVSAELSRDPDQLKRPTTANIAVRRFFKYVQAAKDGQDQKDCLTLYPGCNINTEP